MEVYNIDEMIDKLKQYQTWHGLKYLSRDSVQRIIEDTAQDVPYSPEIPQSIKSLEKHVINAKESRLSKIKLAKALNVSRSTLYKWIDNGILSSIDTHDILTNLKEIEVKNGTRAQLEKIVHHISNVILNGGGNNKIGAQNCKELLGIEPSVLKKLYRGRYITSKTLQGIYAELQYYCAKS